LASDNEIYIVLVLDDRRVLFSRTAKADKFLCMITVGHWTIVQTCKFEVLTGKSLAWSDILTGYIVFLINEKYLNWKFAAKPSFFLTVSFSFHF